MAETILFDTRPTSRGRISRWMLEKVGAPPVSKSPFLAGDDFSAADDYVGSHIGWGFGSIDKRQAFVDDHARLRDRAASERAAVIDDEALGRTQGATA